MTTHATPGALTPGQLVLADGSVKTRDLGGTAGTAEMGRAIVEAI